MTFKAKWFASCKHRTTGLHDSTVWDSNIGSADNGPLSWAEEVRMDQGPFVKNVLSKKWIDIRSDQWCILTNHLLNINSNTYH